MGESNISSFRQGFWAGIQCFWPKDMHIGKNIPVCGNLTFRHSGRAFGPESSVFGPKDMHIGKNIPVCGNLTFRHSGRAFGPESSVFGPKDMHIGKNIPV